MDYRRCVICNKKFNSCILCVKNQPHKECKPREICSICIDEIKYGLLRAEESCKELKKARELDFITLNQPITI